MTVQRANLVYDPEGVAIDLDLQWSGFDGKISTLFGGVTLNPSSSLSPRSFSKDGHYTPPIDDELREILRWTKRPGPPRAPTAEELYSILLVREKDESIRSQAQNFAENPESQSSSFHLDLNRFVKAQSQMRVLKRQ